MKIYAVISAVSVLLVAGYVGWSLQAPTVHAQEYEQALGSDAWDVDQSDVPPATPLHLPEKPRLFEGANLFSFSADEHNRPVLSIAPNPEKPLPVYYGLQSKDSTITMTLSTAPLERHRQRQFHMPTGNTLNIRIVYPDSPQDTAMYHAWRESADTTWQIRVIRTAPFVKLVSASTNQANANAAAQTREE